MTANDINLDDKFTKREGRVFLSGVQALMRIPMVQVWRDREAGRNTGAFISGYRGSPLGGLDQTLLRNERFLAPNDIVFQPGVNEELAATAVWGSQQVHLSPGATKDGVVGIWYGKGPGVDRSGDVFKHVNAAGTSKYGGVLAFAGDDHAAKSSTVPHQSDHAFMSAIMPVLYPSSINEFVEMGLLGIAMSRYSGCWVGFKVIADTVETTAQVDLAGEARQFVLPNDFELPADGLNLRAPDDRWAQDHRLQSIKGYAAIAFARANKVDRIVIDSSKPRFGIVASGKSYEDVRQALRELEIDQEVAEAIGLRVYKVGMPWPLEPEGIRHFSEGLEEVLVVEERREIIEHQIKQQLFNWRADVRPRIVGKFDHKDNPNLPLDVELTVGEVTRAIADRLHRLDLPAELTARIDERLAYFSERKRLREAHKAAIDRLPFYCSGCPHNTSTRVPEGSRALAGIGCHFMVTWMDRKSDTFSQMGGEGVAWTGTAPFTTEEHVFTNLGDGTYFHSGILALRQAIASGVNITYKVLFNDAVAMTGGQPAELTARIDERLAYFSERKRLREAHKAAIDRLPFYCSGCPHNTSTRVPEGSRALAGIGCHFMVTWMDRKSDTFSQMGGEGVAWTGTAPFTTEEHVFTNLGDGTYFHSGILALRQAIASGVNITYKVLFNDAVAMTGGQPVDGTLSVPQLTRQLHAEGVKVIKLLSERPEIYASANPADPLAPGVEVRHRDAIDRTMDELRQTAGCTVIVYDQTCAAEKRRRRKRKLMEDPNKRVFINPRVCEGCGDCSVQSNCVSVEPLETEYGRKRQINQSSCNKDFSCVKGFCPSFVTIEGGSIRKQAPAAPIDPTSIPEPAANPSLDQPYNIAITGVGGTGVLTIGAILGMAAHVEDTASMILDMAGLAQKGGAVLSHVRLGKSPDEVTSPRIVTGGADLLLAADDVVAGSKDGVVLCRKGRTRAIVNTHNTPVAKFVLDRDVDFKRSAVKEIIGANVDERSEFIDFTDLATRACGDAIATNIMMVGFAFQAGLLPLKRQSIEKAIELNGVAVRANLEAFTWGRLLAHDRTQAENRLNVTAQISATLSSMTLDELIENRATDLVAYQNKKLSRRYRALVEKVHTKASTLNVGAALVRTVAANYYKLLAYKDEYEVARLFTDGDFEARLKDQFDGDFKLSFHLAPPLLSKTDPNTNRPAKKAYSASMMRMFRLLRKFKGLRGTPFDPFGRTEERRKERALIKSYEATVNHVLANLTESNLDQAVSLLSIPSEIRGYGPVKMASITKAEALEHQLRREFDHPESQTHAVAAE